MITAASWLLTACGVALIGVGIFFIFFRPPLLPEDARYIGMSSAQILSLATRLAFWLRRVFAVLGGFACSTGLLVIYVAQTGVQPGGIGALAVLLVAGMASIGLMVMVNFALRSDFRWALLSLAAAWASGIAMAATAL